MPDEKPKAVLAAAAICFGLAAFVWWMWPSEGRTGTFVSLLLGGITMILIVVFPAKNRGGRP
jgi:hypothetical protein